MVESSMVFFGDTGGVAVMEWRGWILERRLSDIGTSRTKCRDIIVQGVHPKKKYLLFRISQTRIIQGVLKLRYTGCPSKKQIFTEYPTIGLYRVSQK